MYTQRLEESYIKMNKHQTKNQPTGLRCLFAVLFLILDLAICFILGIIMIFFYYLTLGMNKQNLLKYGPSIATELMTLHFFFYPCITSYPKLKSWFLTQNHYMTFLAYFSCLLLASFASIFLQCLIFDYLWPISFDSAGNITFQKPEYRQFIQFHQLITFLFTTCHAILANSVLYKDIDQLSAAICSELITWVIWGVWINKTISPISNFNQIASYTTWISIVVLMLKNTLKSVNFGFKNDISKFGVLFIIIQAPVIICFTISALLDRFLITKRFDPNSQGSDIWQMAALAYIPSQVVINRIVPLFNEKLLKSPKLANNYLKTLILTISIITICIPLTTSNYIFFNKILYDFFIINLLKCKDSAGNALDLAINSWPLRPCYFFGFGVGIAYTIWFELLESREVVAKERLAGKQNVAAVV